MKDLKSFKELRLFRSILGSALFIFLALFQVGLVFAEVKIAILDSGFRIKADEGISFTSLSVDFDPLNHGTKITQLIRKQNPQAKIFLVQICQPTKFGYEPDINAVIKGIKWAKAQDVDVINLSLTLDYDKKLSCLIEDTYKKTGIIFVAAAGNKSFQEKFAIKSNYVCLKKEDEYSGIKFPANLNSVISVGATDASGKVASYSVGGADIYIDGRYGKEYGTSIAAAKVTGNISKILSRNPNLNVQEIKTILK
ncbi:MAG: S8/S53 family peptidase [Candidatus Omnitrophica bacterium]|nr:S8/S53 family peptidase [Candidatus Omnitrophota bacterium]